MRYRVNLGAALVVAAVLIEGSGALRPAQRTAAAEGAPSSSAASLVRGMSAKYRVGFTDLPSPHGGARTGVKPAAPAELQQEFLESVGALLQARWVAAPGTSSLTFAEAGSGLGYLWQSRFVWRYPIGGSAITIVGRHGYVWVWIHERPAKASSPAAWRPLLLAAWKKYLAVPPPDPSEKVFVQRGGWATLALITPGAELFSFVECARGPGGILVRAVRRSAWGLADPLVRQRLPAPSAPAVQPLNPRLVEYEDPGLCWRRDAAGDWRPATVEEGATHRVWRIILHPSVPVHLFLSVNPDYADFLVPVAATQTPEGRRRYWRLCELTALLHPLYINLPEALPSNAANHDTAQMWRASLARMRRLTAHWKAIHEYVASLHRPAELQKNVDEMTSDLAEVVTGWRHATAIVEKLPPAVRNEPVHFGSWEEETASAARAALAAQETIRRKMLKAGVFLLDGGWQYRVLGNGD